MKGLSLINYYRTLYRSTQELKDYLVSFDQLKSIYDQRGSEESHNYIAYRNFPKDGGLTPRKVFDPETKQRFLALFSFNPEVDRHRLRLEYATPWH